MTSLKNVVHSLTASSVAGLVTAVVGTAVAFGANITPDQTTSILTLTGVLSGILLLHGGVTTVARAHVQAASAKAVQASAAYQGALLSQPVHRMGVIGQPMAYQPAEPSAVAQEIANKESPEPAMHEAAEPIIDPANVELSTGAATS